MRAKFSLMLNVFVFIAGLLFVILYFKGKGVFELVSIILGIMFIMTSCLSLIAVFSKELVHKSKWSIVPIVGGMLLGIALVAANSLRVFWHLCLQRFLLSAAYIKCGDCLWHGK